MPIAAHHGLNNGYHDDAPDLIRSEVVIISSDQELLSMSDKVVSSA